MQKRNLALVLLIATLLVGGIFAATNQIQAAPVTQDASGAANTVFLPFIASQNFAASTATPLRPEQYASESEEAPTIADDLLQAATCWTYIKFTNSSSYSINIYWVNSSGGETLYKTLSSGASYWQQTYWGHIWKVRTTSGTLLKTVTANSCAYIYITITNSDFPQPTATPTKTPVPTATPAACYTSIVATHSNKCMKVKDGSTLSGAEIVQYTCDGTSNQLFSFSLVAGTTNTYVITAKNSGKVLDIFGSSTATGAKVIQDNADGGNSQKWQLIPVSGNIYELKNVNSGLVADVEGASTALGANVIQWTDVNAANQRWQIASCVQPQPTPTNTPAPTNTPTATPTNTPAPAVGSIGDFVWNDLNRNGIQDAGEPGVLNVNVDLLSCTNTFIRSVATNASGNYSFTNLAAGCYLVRVNLPGGFQFSPKAQGTNGNLDSDINIGNATSDAINLAAGQNLTNIDAGINQPVAPTATPTNTPAPALGSIGDRVWNDLNRNGIQDAGEPGIEGISVQLRNCSNGILQTATTNASGLYSFPGLAAGCYIVRFVNINSNVFTFSPANLGGNEALDSDVTALDSVTPGIINGQTDPINLVAGQNLDNVDAGLNQPVAPTATPTATLPAGGTAIVGDRVWNDLNGNGVQDGGGERGVSGVTVELLAGCTGNTVIATRVTNVNGNYTFTGLAAGQYRVRFTLPAGFTGFSPKDAIGDDDYDSEPNADGVTDCFTLTTGQENYSIDAGLTSGGATPTNTPVAPTPTNTPAPALGSIGDKVFRDANGNGVQDSGEGGVSGVPVTLKDCSGNQIQSINTDANGIYTFSGLAAGCYTVTVGLPGGFTYSPQDQGGNDDTDSDVSQANGTTASINLAANQTVTNVDAGLVPQTSGQVCLGDRVWRDTNANGLQDAGEVGFTGVQVFLGVDTNNDGRVDGYRGSRTTDGAGLYQFCGLDPNTPYLLEFVPPLNCGITLPNVGNDDTIDSDANISKGIAGPVLVNQIDNSYDAGLVCHE